MMSFQLMFKTKVGYIKFVEVLKSLGQPSVELLKSVLNLVSDPHCVQQACSILQTLIKSIEN